MRSGSIDVLAVCRADALSDRPTEGRAGMGGSREEQFEALRKYAHDTVEICHGIQARDIDGYKDTEPEKLIAKLRQARIAAVKKRVGVSGSCDRQR